MSKYLSRKPNLAIISDTSMFRGEDLHVFEPVLREVDAFSYLFKEINWLGFVQDRVPPKNAKKEIPDNVNLLLLKPSGGNTIFEKIRTIYFIPYYMYNIIKLIKKADVIYTRGPSMPALITIILSFLFSSKTYWHKYAGNRELYTKAISYRLQRWLLVKNISGIIVVSERKDTDPPNIIQLLNPCLTNKEISINNKIGSNKLFKGNLTICFVGRLDQSKGFTAFITALESSELKKINWLDKIHFVGEHPNREEVFKVESPIPIIFHGLLDRQKLNQIYEDSHFIILPSESEGFPKVIAEASSYGCIPIISPIPSIIYHINDKKKNGILLSDITPNGIIETVRELNEIRADLPILSKNAIDTAKRFSYEEFNSQIIKHILLDTN